MSGVATAIFDALAKNGVEFELTPFSASLRTVDQVAAALDMPPSRIVKALLVEVDDRAPLVVGIPGNRQLDLAVLSSALPAAAPRLAERSAIGRIAGVPPGAVTPLLGALRDDLEIVLDEAVFAADLVNVSSGEPQLGINLRPTDLRRISGGRSLSLESPAAGR